MMAGHSEEGIDRGEITYRLRRLGLTHTRVAHSLGVAPSVVSNTIAGRTTSHRVASYIAGLLGDEITRLWPDQYKFKPRPKKAALPDRQLKNLRVIPGPGKVRNESSE